MATTITQKIVNLVAYLTVAPQPSTLQGSGASVSVGGTTLATNAYQYCGSLSAVEGILGASGNHTELLNMATTHFAQGNAVGLYILELGTPASVDAGILALSTWITNNPGIFYAYLTPANWDTQPAPVAATTSTIAGGTLAATTYYVKVAYVNAAGAVGETSAEVSQAVALDYLLVVDSPSAFIGATGYNVYVSATVGAETLQNASPIAIGTNWTEPTTGLVAGASADLTLAQLCSNYSSPTGKTYFFGTSSSTNITAYGTVLTGGVFSGYKAAVMTVPSPTAQSGEFQAAALFYNAIVNNPSSANKLAPTQFRYVYGVTPFPATGYTTEIDTILTYGGNIISTGAEGGITNTCIFKGTTSSLEQFSWWYGIDWLQIQTKQAVAAAAINGSNQQPPLEYDQAGINFLESVAQQVADNAVTFGCALSALVSAVPFYTYNQQNPNDYNSGIYSGLSCDAVGQNGFLRINFTLDAIQVAA